LRTLATLFNILGMTAINPYSFYETCLSRGRIVFLPVLMISAAAGVVGMACRAVYRVVREILHPRVDQDEDVPSDTCTAALRKIHRMRKPVFMGSLWLRARFDADADDARCPAQLRPGLELDGFTHLASDPACGDGPPPAPFASALPAREEFATTLPIGK
jgi:hypothetical protein